MSALPRVIETTRERVNQEFHDLGPERCLAQISDEMARDNPELLDIARRCAWDVAATGIQPSKVLAGFAMFYRLLLAQWEPARSTSKPSRARATTRSALEVAKASEIEITGCFRAKLARQFGIVQLNPLPRVTLETRDRLLKAITEEGPEAFTIAALKNMDVHNPELLQMAHSFAMPFEDYAGIMRGFAVLYIALTLQAEADKARMH